jgi:hypothetical protein
MKILKLALILAIIIAASANADDKEKFIGTWTLEAFEVLNEDGYWEQFKERSPDSFFGRIGPKPLGYIIYDDAGNMAVQIMGSDRPKFESDDVVNIDAEQIKPAYTGYSAYFGTYEVRESEGIVLHRRIGNLIPNYVGSEVKRAYQLEGDRLMLSATPGSRLVWRKLN